MKTRLIPSPRRAQAGVTRVEAAVVLSISAILTGMAVPSFKRAIERRHLDGAAMQLQTDLHDARMLAVARNTPLRVSFSSGATASGYVIHTGAANTCTCRADGTAQCTGDGAAERSVLDTVGGLVTVASNARSMLLDPLKSTVTPTATVQFTGRSGSAVHQVVNVRGRVRLGSPAPALSGYKAC